jgi:hypothetical protein
VATDCTDTTGQKCKPKPTTSGLCRHYRWDVTYSGYRKIIQYEINGAYKQPKPILAVDQLNAQILVL